MSHWPRNGASVIVYSDGKVLLAKRGKEPFKGYWSLPGGSQGAGETLEECACRELLEETGLIAHSAEFVCVRDRINLNSAGELTHHFVLATYLVLEFTGEASANDDAEEVRWFKLEAIPGLDMTPGTDKLIMDTVS